MVKADKLCERDLGFGRTEVLLALLFFLLLWEMCLANSVHHAFGAWLLTKCLRAHHGSPETVSSALPTLSQGLRYLSLGFTAVCVFR